MKIGVMIGPERGDASRKVNRLLEEIAWAEDAGIPTAWVPQVPSDMDALQMVALLGTRTARIELGTVVVPLQAQHPVALARQALTAHAIAGGRLTLGLGPSHHWIVTDMLGLPYSSFADAGVTDLSVRLLPIGNGRDELIASKNRTREVIAGICADFHGGAELNNTAESGPAR